MKTELENAGKLIRNTMAAIARKTEQLDRDLPEPVKKARIAEFWREQAREVNEAMAIIGHAKAHFREARQKASDPLAATFRAALQKELTPQAAALISCLDLYHPAQLAELVGDGHPVLLLKVMQAVRDHAWPEDDYRAAENLQIRLGELASAYIDGHAIEAAAAGEIMAIKIELEALDANGGDPMKKLNLGRELRAAERVFTG